MSLGAPSVTSTHYETAKRGSEHWHVLYPDLLKSREKFLAVSDWTDFVSSMIWSGFLSEEDRKALTALARDGSSPCRVTRRANGLVLLDEGWSCQQVAHALLLDDDTIRSWCKLFEQRGIEGITSFDVGGSASYLSVKQEDDLKAWVSAALPRSTRQIGAWIETEFGLVDESRSGLIALLHRLGLELQAGRHSAQARRREAEGIHRKLQ